MEIMTEKAWRARQDAIAAVVRMAKRYGWAVPPMADLDLDEIEGLLDCMADYVCERQEEARVLAAAAEQCRRERQ